MSGFGKKWQTRGLLGRVGGIFHSDELPAYGIDSNHVEEVARSLGCGDLMGSLS